MFTLSRYAPKMHPDHNAEAMISVQGQIPNPMTMDEAKSLGTQLKSAMGTDWPFDKGGRLKPLFHAMLPTKAHLESIGKRLGL